MFELDDLTVRFGHRTALDIDHLALGPRSTVAVMGPNGSGKTTLLRLLAGLVEPTAGTIERGGPAGEPAPEVAYIGQHQHQHPWMPLTVAEVVRMGRYRQRGLLRPLDRSDRAVVTDAAARLGVDELLRRSFGELSGGQRQRVLMAAALANRPTVLLLDEPITGLDLPSQQLILDIIDEERDRGRLVVLTTHHLDEARHCARVILLNTTVVADGAPDEVLTPTHLAAAFGPRMVSDTQLFDDHGHGDHAAATTGSDR